jgi:aspartate/methionine/tyrosine aminotransferase
MNQRAQLEPRIPELVQGMKPFLAMEIMEKAQELEAGGRHIIHLEIGEPDLETPSCIREACIRALKDRRSQYTHSLGLSELREEICREYEDRYKVKVTPNRVLITSGTSPAMLLAFSVLCHPGDEVILSDPHYPCYPNFIRYVGARIRSIPVHEHEGFQYSLNAVRESVGQRTRAIVVNSPANPTGTVVPAEILEGLTRLGPTVVSDEIYHGLVYEGETHSALEYSDDAFVLNGFSKLYAMTGWRLGYVIAPEPFMRSLQTLQQNFFISANSFVQWAALTALREARQEVEAMCAIYNERRNLLLTGLRKLGFGIEVEPTGAFYVLANAKTFCTDSRRFAFEILEKAGVGTTPGIDFGPNGEGYIRFTYANSKENIEEALERIGKFLESRQGSL